MKPNTKYFDLTVSEFHWNISENKTIKAWGFNNTLPGPVLTAKQGDKVVVNVHNQLSEATIIHWHGVRLNASMDGTGEVQKPIQPGESFQYEFEVPDAGTFWYHSHYNETSQMERGMYGSLIVEETNQELKTDKDRVFMIDDMKLTKSNLFKEGGRLARWIERHDGRQGDVLLVNGKEMPAIEMNAGQTERWRFINASSARYFRLYLGGNFFKLIGTDGGLLEKPIEMNEIMITPGERVELLVGGFSKGDIIHLESLQYNRVTFLKARRETFATIHVGAEKPSIFFCPESLRSIEMLASQAAAPTRSVKLSVGPSIRRGIDFLINSEMHHTDEPVIVGDLQIWELSNRSLMDHPFHLHGFFFQVIDIDGKPPVYKAWKDTINLKPRSKVTIAWMPDNRPGMWMYHCHILEHHEAGMMAAFEVVDPVIGRKMPAHTHSHSCSI